MINPELLTDDLARQMAKEAIYTHIVSNAEEFICSCCACTAVDVYARRMAHIVKEALSEDEEQKHAELFKALFKSLVPYEKQYKAMLESVWEKERRIVVANIKKMKKAWLHKDKIDDLLYPVGQFEKELSENALKINTTIVDAQGNAAMNELAAVDVMFDVSNPEVQNWLNSYTPKFSKALETVSTDKLRRELIEGIGAGEGIPELLKRVNGTYANWNKVRSEAIARTETLRAANRGSTEAYKQSGVVKAKVWITHFDNRTCAWCKRMNNKVISIEESFFSQGSSFTVDVEGSKRTMNIDYETVDAPPLHTLCRCTVAASFYDPREGVAQPSDLFDDWKTNPTKYKKEHGAWLDKQGRVIVTKKGTTTHVSLGERDWKRLMDKDIGTMIHTHPQHMAFSGGDLAHAASLNIGEMQVLTHKGLYKIKPKVGRNWVFNKDVIEGEYNSLIDSLREKYNAKYNRLFNQGKTMREAREICNAERIDEALKALSKKYKLDYSYVGD